MTAERHQRTFDRIRSDDQDNMPRYDIKYRQKVSPEDMYLGLSGRSHSILHANDLTVTIELPGVMSISEIDLDCKPDVLEVRTKK